MESSGIIFKMIKMMQNDFAAKNQGLWSKPNRGYISQTEHAFWFPIETDLFLIVKLKRCKSMEKGWNRNCQKITIL